jgi:hypothetical protein
MSLREQLRDLLPQILPATPVDAIKGTELIRLVRLRLKDDYSDATLRYHFSILSYDPSSPIAKVDQGQGYYLRLNKVDYRHGGRANGLFVREDESTDIGRSRLARFEAVVERHCLHGSRFPFLLSPQGADAWELPDLVITDWDLEAGQDDTPRLDEGLMNLKRHLGASVVTLTASQLQLRISLETCRADFFKTLSAARWANQGQLFIAEPVNDEALVDALRTLGQEYGIGVTSFGLEGSLLDELPSPDEIRRVTAAEFESLQATLRIQRISSGTHRPQIDWHHLSVLRKKHDGLASMLSWLSDCLEKRQPVPAR